MTTDIPLSAVVFDFDGVLVDTERLHYEAYQAVLRPEGVGFGWEEYAERYMCFGDEDAIRLAFRTVGREVGSEALAALIDRKGEAFAARLAADEIPVFEGVEDLLAEIRAAGLPCAVCSAASRRDIERVLDGIRLADRFHVVVSADDVEIGKPDPACYRLAVRALADRFPRQDIAAPAVVAIEDTPGGVRAARGAGLRVLAVGTTHREHELTEAHGYVDRLSAVTLDDLRRRFGGEGR